MRAASAAQTLARLRADPQVEYAEEDQRRYAQALPDDPLFAGQWYLQNTQPAAIDAVEAWDLTTGSDGVVIAELDTGVRFDHPDLRSATAQPPAARLRHDRRGLAAAFLTANDGDGRDADASDPGDWVSAADTQERAVRKCDKVATAPGTARASPGSSGRITNNGVGIAGVAWSGVDPAGARARQVRRLRLRHHRRHGLGGRHHVDGVPDNPYPARIINMSLGAPRAMPVRTVTSRSSTSS